MHLWDNVQCGTCSIHQVDVECRVIEIERSLISEGILRLFFSTIDPLKLARQLEGFENIPSTFNGGKWELYSPMLIYAERWILEVTFENMKTFWSLADYKVRDEHSLLTFVNLINLAYTGTVLLPYLVPQYAEYKDLSPQEIRKSISQQLWEEIDIANSVSFSDSRSEAALIACMVEMGYTSGLSPAARTLYMPPYGKHLTIGLQEITMFS